MLRKGVAGMQGKIKSLEQIFLFSLPVKEYQIVESFLQSSLKDEVMKIMPVQKQTRAGQRTRFKVRANLIKGRLQSAEIGGSRRNASCRVGMQHSSWLYSRRLKQLPEGCRACHETVVPSGMMPHRSVTAQAALAGFRRGG